MIRPTAVASGIFFSAVLNAATFTNTTLTVTPAAPEFGRTITLVASVFPSTASGFVSFMDGGVLVGSAVVNISGVAQATTITLSSGSHSLVAVYGGNTGGGYGPSQSLPVPYVVTPVSGAGFAAQVTYATGGDANSVTIGDFNGDGKADLAVVNGAANNVSILLGNGNGTFLAAVNYFSGGNEPSSVAAGDFNGDGHADLVLANAGSNNVSVLLGNGDGTFQAAMSYAAGAGPDSVAVGDFNGDGKADLAIANGGGANNVSILLGNGDGTFQAPTNYGVGMTPFSVAIGDFNGDGKPDLAVANFDSNNVSVLLGNGDGTFQAAMNNALAGPASGVAVADFNQDGRADLAVVVEGSNNVEVLLGNGDGTLQTPLSFSVGADPSSLTVGDFNADGKPDLAVTNQFGASASVLLGNGNGTFQAAASYAAGSGPYSVAVGDFNGDGIADLAVANITGNNVSVLLGAALPSTTTTLVSSANPSVFGQPVALTATVVPSSATGMVEFLDGTTVLATKLLVSGQAQLITSLLPADANPLRAVYLGSPGAWQSSQSSVLHQAVNPQPASGFTTPVPYPAGSVPVFVTTGDFNGDGKADLAVANEGANIVSVLLGNGNGTFQSAQNSAVGSFPVSAAVGDFNGDGNPDLAAVNENSGSVSVLLGKGNGTFQPAVNYTVGSLPESVAVGDFNGDGKLDLAVANSGSNFLSVLLGNGDGTFKPAQNYASASGVVFAPVFVTVGDFNGDGKPDLAAANEPGNNVSVLLGNGNGTFQTPINHAAGANPVFVLTADFNADGNADLAVANSGSNNVSVLLGNGDGTFQAAVNYPAGISPNSIAVGDFNGDGMLDLAVADLGANNVTLLLGNGNGTFQAGVGNTVSSGTTSVAVGEFNGDGRSDLAVAGSGGVSILLGSAPTVLSPASVTPASGSGATQTFSFTLQDPAGYADLKILDVLTSTFLDGQTACYFAFLPSSASAGTVYLVDDAGDAGGPFAGSLLINGSGGGTINNSQCTINASGSSVSASGNTLTLNLVMSFAPGWAGDKAFYMAARTATQNSGWEALGTWSVPGTLPAGPQIGPTTPARSVSTGQTYTFTFNDSAGYGDLFVLDVLTGSFLNGSGACYFAYVPTSASNGYLYLVDDAGDGGYAPGSPIALSSGGTLSNSQCTLNTTGSSASGSGNTLTLNLPIAFKPSFAGNQVFFEAARNNSTGNSGWQAAGSVTVP